MTPTILNAAYTIKPLLPELLDTETAAQVAQQLETLLTQAAAGQLIDNQITEVLRAHETTQTWMRRYLKGEAPADITRSISGLPGNMEARPRKPEYQCPECHKQYAELPQSRIPTCPDHPHQPLTLIQP
jgi:hypothetical protein